MAQSKGSLSQLIIQPEDYGEYGTTPLSVSMVSMPFMTCSLKGERALKSSSVIRGNRNPTMPDQGNTTVGGDVVIPVDIIGIGYWLEMLLGEPQTTGSASPYTHTFRVQDEIPPFTIEKGWTDNDLYMLYNGCKASSISFEFGGDDELKATVSLLGAKETAGTTSVDATPTTFSLTKFGNFQAAVTEGGSSIATVKTVKMTISNDLDEDTFCIGGGGIRPSLPEGIVKVSGSITAMFEDLTLLNKAINGTESSLAVVLTSGSYSLSLYVDELIYSRQSPGIDTPKGTWIELPFEGYYDNDADATAFRAILVNSQATYPNIGD